MHFVVIAFLISLTSATPFLLGSPEKVRDQRHLAVQGLDVKSWWYSTIQEIQQFSNNITGPNNCWYAVERMKYNVYMDYNSIATSNKLFTDHYFYGRNMIYWYGYNSAQTVETYNWDFGTF